MKINYLLVTAGLFLWSCSNQIQVKSDYDREVNFSRYTTYNWLSVKDIEAKNNPLFYNELTDKRIKKAVDLQLQIKRIQHTLDSPALLVHYHIVIDNKTVVRPDPYGYYYGPYWMRSQTNIYQYKEGTLIIDLMDATNKSLLWRGWAIAALDNDVDLTEKEINDAVYKILKEFPPTK